MKLADLGQIKTRLICGTLLVGGTVFDSAIASSPGAATAAILAGVKR